MSRETDKIYRNAVDPTINDDISSVPPYEIGDEWLNTVTDNLFELLDDTAGAAVWANKTSSFSSSKGSATNGILYTASTWTDNTDGTITLPALDAILYDDQVWSGSSSVYAISGGTTGTEFPALTDEDTNYVYIDYNAGSPIFVVSNIEPDYKRSDICKYLTIYREGTFLHVLNWDHEGSGLTNKLLQRHYEIRKLEIATGVALSLGGTDPLQVNIGAGTVWNGVQRTQTTAVDSYNDTFFSNYHSAGVWDKDVSGPGSGIANNQYYDDGTNRVALGAGVRF